MKKKSLKKYNTFGIEAFADEILSISSIDQLKKWYQQHPNEKFLVLGQGSNVLFLEDFEGTVLINEIKGKQILKKDSNKIILHVKGGENWHELVMWAVNNNYGGIENLALIPGKTGTAPIQNIGAYGKEIKDVISKVYAYDFHTGKDVIFDKDACSFGYRDSIFKKPENKNRYFITAVDLILSTKNHQLNASYGAIQDFLNKNQIKKPGIKDIADAVIHIRQSKLPDPAQIGNAGSFFKNPVVERKIFERLKEKYPQMPSYEIDPENIKIPAGWLIEKAGWKGKRIGNVGVHDKQALVLVHYGNGNGQEIKNLADQIIRSVQDKFEITLTPEVNFIA